MSARGAAHELRRRASSISPAEEAAPTAARFRVEASPRLESLH